MIIFWFKEAFKSIGRAKSSFILSLISTSISVLLIVSSIILVQLSNKFQTNLKEKLNINIFLKDSVSKNSISNIGEILNSKKYINSVKFIDKDEAAQNFIKDTGEDFRKILDYNPLPVSYSITLKEDFVKKESIDKIVSELSKINGVDEIVYQYKFANKVLSFIDSIKKYVFIITAVLFIISLYIVFSTVKLVISLKQEEFETMKLVGAKLSTIKMPVIINGIFIGFLGGIIALGIFLFVLSYFGNLIAFKSYFNSINIYLLIMVLIGPALGFLVSTFALRRINLRI
ncbi:MAG: permease-like cell division protein FtsX [Ignavibacteriaceae bacterium]